jgi:hypothetical protein
MPAHRFLAPLTLIPFAHRWNNPIAGKAGGHTPAASVVRRKNMRNICRLFATLSAGAVMSAVFGASTVHAADDKVYPATHCVFTAGADSTPWYGPAGQVFNQGSTTAHVRCPTVRDNGVTSWTTVQVVVIDQSFNADVNCRAVSASRDGTSSLRSSYRTTSGNSSTGKVLSLTPPTAFSAGSYMIECQIPPQNSEGIHSGIASYYIVEP